MGVEVVASATKESENLRANVVPPGCWTHVRILGRLPVHLWPAHAAGLREVFTEATGGDSESSESDGTAPFEAGILVVSMDDPAAPTMLRELRAREDTRLLPIAVLPVRDGADARHAELADAVLPTTPALMLSALLELETRLERVSLLPPPDPELSRLERRELDFLRFLHSRHVAELAPLPDRSSPIGFRYPLAEHLLCQSPLETLQTLQELVAFDVFTAELVERVYLCPGCNSNQVTLREVCPGCRVPALVGHEVIHHFRCAHVGPSTSFQREERLRCPKCDQDLLHVGVDHDKPGVEQHCGHCKTTWLEGLAELRCLGCDVRVPPEQARLLDLPVFRAAAGLERSAEQACPPLTTASKLLSTFVQPSDPAVFKLFREHAERVCRRFGRPASLLRITIRDLRSLQDEVGRHDLRRMLTRFAQSVRQLIRSTDIVGVSGEDGLEVVLVETDAEGAQCVLGRIESSVDGWGLPDLPLDLDARPLVDGGGE